MTVCSSLDLVNITSNNFVAPDEKTAVVSMIYFILTGLLCLLHGNNYKHIWYKLLYLISENALSRYNKNNNVNNVNLLTHDQNFSVMKLMNYKKFIYYENLYAVIDL